MQLNSGGALHTQGRCLVLDTTAQYARGIVPVIVLKGAGPILGKGAGPMGLYLEKQAVPF